MLYVYPVVLFFILFSVIAIIGFGLIDRGKRSAKQMIKVREYMEINDLNERDLKVFKDTMFEAKYLINDIQSVSLNINDKELIEEVNQGISAAKSIFEFLVKNPQKLIDQGNFLYRDLPAFKNILSNYSDLLSSEVHSKELLYKRDQYKSLTLDICQIIVDELDQITKEKVIESKGGLIIVAKGKLNE